MFGDKLIVGIDSDERVKSLKGDSRPFNSQEDRKEMLLSIKHIDNVCIFNDRVELENLVFNISPDYMIVGDDYKNKEVIGSDFAKKLIFFNKINGYSTTKILKYNESITNGI